MHFILSSLTKPVAISLSWHSVTTILFHFDNETIYNVKIHSNLTTKEYFDRVQIASSNKYFAQRFCWLCTLGLYWKPGGILTTRAALGTDISACWVQHVQRAKTPSGYISSMKKNQCCIFSNTKEIMQPLNDQRPFSNIAAAS